MPAGYSSPLPRRHDFDWLRIGALALLIFTHTTYVYRTVHWRVQSEHAGLWADMLIYMMAPWRICLVFFIAGAATRFMLERNSLSSFIRNRTMRLFVPFLVALVLLVPTMQYMSEPALRGSSYLDFLIGPGLHNRQVLGVWLPDMGHVWFLVYVFAYAIAAGLVWRFWRPAFEAVDRAINAAPPTLVIAGLAGAFVLSDAVLGPFFPRTDMFIDDPAGHVRAIAPFVLGLVLARPSGFWTRLARARLWIALAAVALVCIAIPFAMQLSRTIHPPLSFLQLVGLASGTYAAVMLMLILSLARRLFAQRGPGLDYLGDAIMPIYLMHQPVVVFVAEALRGAGLPLWAEFGMVLGLAGGFPLFVYHFVVRPTPVLRAAFGLKANARTDKQKPARRPVLAA